MAFLSVYRPLKTPSDVGWSSLTSRALLHDLTDILQKAEDIAKTDPSLVGPNAAQDTPYSEQEFLPVLANAILCRGQPQLASHTQPPIGCLLCYTVNSGRKKYFPTLIKVDLGNQGHLDLPTRSTDRSRTTVRSYTPLPENADSKRVCSDRFWQMLASKEPNMSGTKRKYETGNDGRSGHSQQATAGSVLLDEFCRLCDTNDNGNKSGVTKHSLFAYITEESTTSNYINMEHFYEGPEKLLDACQNRLKKIDSTNTRSLKQDYAWNPDEKFGNAKEKQVAQEIREALSSGNLLQISNAARMGMTSQLFDKLVQIRRKYQEWRATLGNKKEGSHGAFKKWYYDQDHDQE